MMTCESTTKLLRWNYQKLNCCRLKASASIQKARVQTATALNAGKSVLQLMPYLGRDRAYVLLLSCHLQRERASRFDKQFRAAAAVMTKKLI